LIQIYSGINIKSEKRLAVIVQKGANEKYIMKVLYSTSNAKFNFQYNLEPTQFQKDIAVIEIQCNMSGFSVHF